MTLIFGRKRLSANQRISPGRVFPVCLILCKHLFLTIPHKKVLFLDCDDADADDDDDDDYDYDDDDDDDDDHDDDYDDDDDDNDDDDDGDDDNDDGGDNDDDDDDDDIDDKQNLCKYHTQIGSTTQTRKPPLPL